MVVGVFFKNQFHLCCTCIDLLKQFCVTNNRKEMIDEGKTFFEGTEKLLEVWFSRSDGNTDDFECDLRNIPRHSWDALLKLVRCSIISFESNSSLDAYVLSESSMLVSKNRFILKTCGTTTMLMALQPLIFLVKSVAGFDKVQDLFYSRKNFMKPELQPNSHQSFENEIAFLDSMFEKGAAYCFGSINQDCWYLYTLFPTNAINFPDQTLEIIMQELDPEKMQIFTKEFCENGYEATKKSGIDQLLPNVIIDDCLFEPCGYSMNGIMAKGHYFTIHITPEPQCSYVSFESNIPQESYRDLIIKLLKMFDPKKFMLTIFANEESVANESHVELQDVDFVDYQRIDLQLSILKNYKLTYLLFAKAPS